MIFRQNSFSWYFLQLLSLFVFQQAKKNEVLNDDGDDSEEEERMKRKKEEQIEKEREERVKQLNEWRVTVKSSVLYLSPLLFCFLVAV